jgi:hypothetical protein
VPRARRLLERDPEELVPLLVHPAQVAAEAAIADLIRELRAIVDDEGRNDFQRELFKQIYDVEQARHEAKRQAKLASKGKPVGHSDMGLEWAVEELLWARIARQLRSVGDAMAWKLLAYNRRAILALSHNDPAGPMYGKAGLGYELGAVDEAWKNDRQFALLHDVTNCLRIGDITYFTGDGPRIAEVKARPPSGSRARQQLRRAQEAVDVANGAALLGGTVRVLDTPRPLVTLLAQVGPALAAAVEQGMVAERIADRQAVHVFTVAAAAGDITTAEIESRIQQLTSDAFALAGLDRPGQHHLQGHRIDLLDKGVHNAPYTIFPWPPEIVAALTTDRMGYRHTVAYDRLAERFEHNGMRSTCLLPEDGSDRGLDLARIQDPVTKLRVRLDVGILDRLLYEFIDLDCLVDAVAEQIRGEAEVGEEILTTFVGEADVWA